MPRQKFTLVAAAVTAAFGFGVAPASAEGFAVSDMGMSSDKAQCVRRAEAAFERFEKQYGAGYRTTNDWVVYQYDIGPQNSDAFIACINVGERSLGFLTVFSAREATGEVRDRVAEYFRNAN
ncbi:MAG: hypothetical protein ROR55_09895 [Devosia sp.]